MGLFSFLFAPPAPQGPAPWMQERSRYSKTEIPPEDYTVIDLETSGLYPTDCEILELAAIRYRDGEPVAQCRTYVKPEGRISREASKVNHITWSKVYNAPAFDDVIWNYLAFLGDDTLIGYNVGFDMRFLQTRTQVSLKNEVFDVMPFAKRVLPKQRNYKLDTLRWEFSLGGQAHTSLGDCEATARLYQICRDMAGYR